jgi:hypothetical protein
MLDSSQGSSVGLPAGVDAVVVAALVVGVALAGVFALLKGYGRDPLEKLSTWARGRGLEYRPPSVSDEIASFVGEIAAQRVEVTVRRVPGRRLVDLPPQVTTIAVSSSGTTLSAAGSTASATRVVIQPASWVIDREGLKVVAATPTGDEAFDARWSARGESREVVRLLTAPARARLMAPDAEGLVIEVSEAAVEVTMPGVCSEPSELERRLSIASDLARASQ